MNYNTFFSYLSVALFLLMFSINAQTISAQSLTAVSENNNTVSLSREINVVGTITGQLTDCNTGIAMQNVAVVADNGINVFEAETDQNGNYSLTADTATYEISFVLLGFQTETQTDITVNQGDTITVNESLCEMPYPVSNVVATPEIACDDEIIVSWDPPMGVYAIIQDDGSAEDFFAWAQAGGAVAVKFSPAGYPATVTGGKLFVGDGTFPAGGDWLGDNVAVGVADDDGTNGMPGIITDSVIVSVDEYGWLEFPDVFESEFNEGDFYIVMWQLGNSPDAAPVGVDTDQPTVFKSYSKMPGGDWAFSPYQDFMIRAEVSGPTNSVNLNSNRDLNKYNVFRMFGFDPDAGEGPEDGVPTGIGYNFGIVIDYMNGCPPGFYAHAVEAEYDNGDKSPWAYSNIFAWCLDNVAFTEVTVCDGTEPADAIVKYVGLNYPYQILIDTTGPDGVAVFDSVIDGHYDITIEKVGYQDIHYYNVAIYGDHDLSVVLQENPFPARNLFVNALTSVATWDEALIQPLLLEDFEDEEFPPEGWEIVLTEPDTAIDWHRLNSVYGIPPQNEDGTSSWYAANIFEDVLNSFAGMLLTPMVDLRQSETFKLYFDCYYDGAYGQIADVLYSIDGGETWLLVQALSPSQMWSSIEIDLSPLSGIENGNNQVYFAFSAGELSNWSYGNWAIDNVCISNGPAPIYGYYVYLDDEFMGETTPETTTFAFENLEYGTEYYAKVRALYSCGLSATVDYIWNSTYLYPPRNLSDDYIYNTNEVPLIWNPPVNANGDSVPDGVLSFNIYRNGDSLTNIVYDSLVPPDFDFIFVDTALNPGTYLYNISAIYDLSVFDTTLQSTGESMLTETVEVEVIWGNGIPFFEDWAQGSFDFQQWETDGTNWVINSSTGNDAPSAEFSWEPLIEEDYSVLLTSNYLRADSLSEGEIFLEFDLKLEDRNTTYTERLVVQYRIDNGPWSVLETFVNNGSFDFTFNRIELPHWVMEDAFQIRFNAIGQNSYDIVGWYIDNISVYRSCKAPAELTGEYVWNSEDNLGIELCWESPDIEYSCNNSWLKWENDDVGGDFGLSEEGSFSCAARWDAGMLEDCDGSFITKIRFFPSMSGFSTITVKVWYGPNASTLVAEKEVSINDIIIGMYNEVNLNDPVEIDASQELWVGYTIVQVSPGTSPAGYDSGPAVVGYGDKVSFDGSTWENLSDLGPDFNNNWSIRALVESLDDPQAKPISLTESTYNSTGDSFVSKKNMKDNSATRDLEAFNIYRKQPDHDYQLYAQVDAVSGQDYYCFWDAFPAVNLYELYSYQVIAVYESEIDDCESVPARAFELPENDFVEVFVTDIENHKVNSEMVNLYPNPVSNNLTITSLLPLNKITVYDSRGNLIFNSDVQNSTSFNLNTSSYTNGIYIVKMRTEKTTIVKRFVVAR